VHTVFYHISSMSAYGATHSPPTPRVYLKPSKRSVEAPLPQSCTWLLKYHVPMCSNGIARRHCLWLSQYACNLVISSSFLQGEDSLCCSQMRPSTNYMVRSASEYVSELVNESVRPYPSLKQVTLCAWLILNTINILDASNDLQYQMLNPTIKLHK
jgi:hypothetical protein